jgi:hypothetical protein
MVIRSVDKRDAQHLMVILPGLEEQGKPIENVVLGPELVVVWTGAGHLDGLRRMTSRVYKEEGFDVATPLWIYPPRTLILHHSEESPPSPDFD